MDAETRHTLAVTDPRAFVRHPFFSSSPESESESSSWSSSCSSFSSNCALDSPEEIALPRVSLLREPSPLPFIFRKEIFFPPLNRVFLYYILQNIHDNASPPFLVSFRTYRNHNAKIFSIHIYIRFKIPKRVKIARNKISRISNLKKKKYIYIYIYYKLAPRNTTIYRPRITISLNPFQDPPPDQTIPHGRFNTSNYPSIPL